MIEIIRLVLEVLLVKMNLVRL